MRTPTDSDLVFAVPPSVDEVQDGPLLASLAAYLTRRLGSGVVVKRAVSYEDLAGTVYSGDAHAAWLPPALLVELERSVGMRPVAAAERGEGVGYYCAYFSLIDSDVASLSDIPGHSVGWVDPSSASGYVFPRLQLASIGIDPATAFQEEVFLRSHAAVVRAVADRAVDIGATYVHLDPSHARRVIRAGWRPPPEGVDPSAIQWLDPFGPLPPDVIAVRADVSAEVAEKLGEAFMTLNDEMQEINRAAQRHFGTGRFVQANPRAYDILRRSLDSAEGSGVEVLASLRPSHPM
jgi:phosphate/phosphite/phosphonate ABC transporter binding protein